MMKDLIATREAYGQTLQEIGKDRNIIVMDADLSKSTKTAEFKKLYPERFFSAGIAEANMVSVAAGLATCGKTVFVSSYAVFATGRAYDQIRASVCYPKLNVKIGASHAGISVGEDGATHQSTEDISLMRSLPNMVVVSPCDAVETIQAVKAAAQTPGPFYLRFGRLPVPIINDKNTYEFKLGKGVVLKEGKDITIVATGLMVAEALNAAVELEKSGIRAEVINIHTIKPIDRELLINSAKKTGRVLTVEEHSIIGGLGSAVAEVLAEEYPVPVKRMGMNDCFGKSGKAKDVLEFFGLTADNIKKKVMDLL
jgi:transketolase